jgi:hypothetical protein
LLRNTIASETEFLNAIGAYNPVQINQTIQRDAVGLVAQALCAGSNQDRVVMGVAKARGFTPGPKAAAPVETEQKKQLELKKDIGAAFRYLKQGIESS